MTMKESSDDPTHVIVTDAALLPHAPVRGLRDYVAIALATCGVGLIPLAPGTWGSLVGVFAYIGVRAGSLRLHAAARAADWPMPPSGVLLNTILLLVLSALALAGVWAATRCEALLKRKDPGAVVIDEVVGQLLTFAFVPFGGRWTLLLGFLVFRLFDIWKPYPIRRLEALQGGLGIMADDVLAGFYAAVLLSLATTIYLLF
ncbi:MAG TPA: phosphatidylglycerophosphatase A [Pyrinomonadaceae bacterium]|jgi:phosphatidylglycerophosphatase A